MAKKPAATKAEQDHMDAVRELGCLICRRYAQIHHVTGHAYGSRSNLRVLPLCADHHQNLGYGHALHNGTKQFEANYKTQAEMLEQVNRELEG